MGKNKPTTVNKINQINLEIDYDKLAQAIVKAQEKTKSISIETAKKEKTGFFKSVWKILKGERSKDGSFLSAPFTIIIYLLYRIIAIIGFFAMIVLDVESVIAFTKMSWQGTQIIGNIIAAIIVIVVSAAIFLYMLLFWGAANEIEHEKDKNYVMSVFSGLVSVASLIVAIIILIKENG